MAEHRESEHSLVRVLWIGAVVAGGCGPGEPGASRGTGAPGHGGDLARITRIQWSPASPADLIDGPAALVDGPAALVDGEEVLARVRAPADLDGWEVKADGITAPDVAQGTGLALAGVEQDVVVREAFGVYRFNVVRLRLGSTQSGEVSLLARVAGRPFAESESIVFEPAPGDRELDIDFPALVHAPAEFDELLLRIRTKGGSTELREIALVERPLESFLPEAAEPALVRLDRRRGASRRAVGLTAGSPLSASVDYEPGDEFVFAFGVPRALRHEGHELRLTARVEGADGEVVQESHALDTGRATAREWQDVALALPRSGSGPVRATLTLAADGGGPAACVVAEARLRQRGRAPTVLLVTSDTHRADHVGVAGAGVGVDTPAIDALAARGAYFEDCYASTNVTQPSHTALLTGMPLRDHGVLDNSSVLGSEAATLAEAFSAGGYRTFAVVSVKHLDVGSGLGQGFDRLVAPATTWAAGEARGHLERALADAEGEPAFCWLHLFDAHAPYEPPEPFDRCYYPGDRNPRAATWQRPDVAPGCIPDSFEGIRDFEFPRAQYRAEVRYLDDELGKLLRTPRLQEAVIALTADHGEVFERAGSYFNHASLVPATLGVPLVIAWPGSTPARVAQPVEQLDLGRTLLDLAGLVEVPFPGRNLIESLSGEAPAGPRFAISAHGRSASVSLAGWHAVLHLEDHKGRFPERKECHSLELFRLAEDPECVADVARTEPERARRLRGMIVEWLESARPGGLAATGSGRRTVSSSEEQQLRALGYVDEGAGIDRAPGAWIDAECDCARCSEFR